MNRPIAPNFTTVSASAHTKRPSTFDVAQQLANAALITPRSSTTSKAGAGPGSIALSPALDSKAPEPGKLVSADTWAEAKQLLGEDSDEEEAAADEAKDKADAEEEDDGTAFTLFGVTVKPTLDAKREERARLTRLEMRARTAAEMDDVFRRYLGIERSEARRGITYYCDLGISGARLTAINVLAGDSDPFVEIQRLRGVCGSLLALP